MPSLLHTSATAAEGRAVAAETVGPVAEAIGPFVCKGKADSETFSLNTLRGLYIRIIGH
jgi:hypothetical protein